MSKMGISTLKSYCGAQIFDAIGLSEGLVENFFCGTSSLIGGINLNQLQRETLDRYNRIKQLDESSKLLDGGEYAFRYLIFKKLSKSFSRIIEAILRSN